jgi:hypothetical protein
VKTIRPLALLGLCLTAVFVAGCFDVEQSMTLNKDLSGQAGFAMTVNMEPMVMMMLRMQREMAGTQGDPTAAEIAKAKSDFLAQRKEKSASDDFKAKRADFEKNLPPGVQLIDGGVDDQGLKMLAHFHFRFDNVAKLGQIQFAEDKGQQQPGPKNPFEQPFGGIRVVDEGKTVLLTGVAVNPIDKQAEAQQGGPELPPEAKQQMEEAFKGFRVAFKLDTPMEVVESNATRREGHTLYWEYDLHSVEKMSKEQLQQGIRVRLRK